VGKYSPSGTENPLRGRPSPPALSAGGCHHLHLLRSDDPAISEFGVYPNRLRGTVAAGTQFDGREAGMEVRTQTRKQAATASASNALARYRSERMKERARILRVQNQMLVSAERSRRAKRFV
jgi:hypothetical protein